MRDDGFLADEMLTLITKARSEYQELFKACVDLNREGHQLIGRLHVEPDDERQVLIACLLARCLDHYQAVILLAERGMKAPASASLRHLLEAVFTLKAVARSDDMLRAYILDDEKQRLKLMRKAKTTTGSDFEALRKAVRDDDLVSMQTVQEGIQKIKTEDLARVADMENWYRVMYALLSYSVHSHVRDLEQYLKLDEQRNFIGLQLEPDYSDTPLLLATAGICMTLAVADTAVVFGIEPEAAVKSRVKDFDDTLRIYGIVDLTQPGI
jgi:uncharacterized protein DUF5677